MLSIAQLDENGFIAATLGTDQFLGFVYESVDGGQTWSETDVTFVGEGRAVTSWSDSGLCVGLRADSYLSSFRGLVKCKDGGDWLSLSFSSGVHALASTSEGDLYIGTEDGLYRRANDGSIDQVLADVEIAAIESVGPFEDLIVGTSSGAFRCVDFCTEWMQLGLKGVPVLSMSVLGNHDLLFGTPKGLFRLKETEIDSAGLNGKTIGAIASVDLNHWIVGTDQGVYSTDDGGSTFTALPVEFGRVYSIQTYGGNIIVGAARGIFRFEAKAEAWSKVGVANTYVAALASAESGSIYAATMDAGVFRSTDFGGSWNELGLDDKWITSIAVGQGGQLVAGTFLDGLFYSTDDGLSWEQKGAFSTLISAITFDDNDCTYVGTTGVTRSCDQGLTWVSISDGLDVVRVEELLIADNNDLFAATSNGIFLLREGRSRWERILCESTRPCWYYDVIESHDGSLFALGEERLYSSRDGGQSWQTSTSSLSAQRILVDKDGTLFAATNEQGVLRSSDDGRSWESMASGLPIDAGSPTGAWITDMIIDSKGFLVAGTNMYGSFRTRNTVGSSSEHIPITPIAVHIFPNPIRHSATLLFSASWDGAVEISLYDVLGRRVDQLLDKYLLAGSYELVWDREQLASGVYFCQIHWGEWYDSIAIILE